MKLLELAKQCSTATTTAGEILALHQLRCYLVDNELELMLELDAAIARQEAQLDPAAYDTLRRLGFTFYTDLESARELLTNPEEPDGFDGLLPDFGEME